jgi:dienelactone hydrolase
VIERGIRAVEGLLAELVYAGFSLGVLPAQKLAQTRLNARGSCCSIPGFPVEEFGSEWPDGVPVQIHGMDADPIFVGEGDIDAARALVASIGQAELFLYSGGRHYFAPTARCRPTAPRPPYYCSTARMSFSPLHMSRDECP